MCLLLIAQPTWHDCFLKDYGFLYLLPLLLCLVDASVPCLEDAKRGDEIDESFERDIDLTSAFIHIVSRGQPAKWFRARQMHISPAMASALQRKSLASVPFGSQANDSVRPYPILTCLILTLIAIFIKHFCRQWGSKFLTQILLRRLYVDLSLMAQF